MENVSTRPKTQRARAPEDPFDQVAAAAARLKVRLDDTSTVSDFLRDLAASSPQMAAAMRDTVFPPADHPTPDVEPHVMVSGWGGVPGECGVECSCGVAFDGFETIAEASTLLNQHIADSSSDADASDGPDQPAVEHRPYWQTRPCPAWCIGGHEDGHHLEDRFHYGPNVPASVPLTQHDPGQAVVDGKLTYRPPCVEVDAEQHVNHVEPTVKLCIDGATALLRMTIDEADQLRAELAATVSMLTGGTR